MNETNETQTAIRILRDLPRLGDESLATIAECAEAWRVLNRYYVRPSIEEIGNWGERGTDDTAGS